MKTMFLLCDLFMKRFPGYFASFDSLEAHRGYYPVDIGAKNSWGIPTRYVFTTTREFREWINGIVID